LCKELTSAYAVLTGLGIQGKMTVVVVVVVVVVVAVAVVAVAVIITIKVKPGLYARQTMYFC
jgi:hypothetical protein